MTQPTELEKSDGHQLLPTPNGSVDGAADLAYFSRRSMTYFLGVMLALAVMLVSHAPGAVFGAFPFFSISPLVHNMEPFYASTGSPAEICSTGISHAGYIGLKGDTDEKPRRSFYWYFEAQNDPKNAPLILTFGGGPGSSGLLGPFFGQSSCIMTDDGVRPNPNAWTEKFNLLALEHPIGTGYSYGTMVNNSRSAAEDVYDFLQKFFRLYPHLANNPFFVSGGSYGGIHVPHVATVIHERNLAIQAGKGPRGAIHINLDALLVSNPFSDPISYFRWILQYRCNTHNVYNSTTCQAGYEALPSCLEQVQYALENSTPQHRRNAMEFCETNLMEGDSHGTVIEDVRKKCSNTSDIAQCYPVFAGIQNLFENATTKETLGVPKHVTFQSVNDDVYKIFTENGDIIQQAYLLYEPLLKDGIRVIHYIGAMDANCPWLGSFSFLKLLKSPFHDEFLSAPDIPWPPSSPEEATVRAIGHGAGNFTFILVAGAGHFVVYDQPALVKKIVEHWIQNEPWF